MLSTIGSRINTSQQAIVFTGSGVMFSLAFWTLLIGGVSQKDGRYLFDIFAIIPTFLGLLSLLLLNTVLDRKTILESPADSLQSTRPKRIMVFVCVVGSLASVAMAVLLGLLRYMPMGAGDLATAITCSSICLLSSNFVIFFGRPLDLE